ncbi:MAG: FlgD immunoglobulin-like domain containing protein [Bacteroidota bacterium]
MYLRPWLPLAAIMLLLVPSSAAVADGTETLGPLKGVTLATGTGIVVAGVGLADPEGDKVIRFDIPDDATVKQAFVYWEGQTPEDGGLDVDFKINGMDINAADPGDASADGNRIGAPILFYSYIPSGENELRDIYAVAYRYEITDMGLVVPGENALTISELDEFGLVTDGIGVLVVFSEPSRDLSEIDIRDGIDLAFIHFEEPKKSTIPQTFVFASAEVARKATLSMFFSSVQGPISMGGTPRPTSIEVSVGGTKTVYSSILGSNDGDEWDSVNLEIDIRAGASSLTVQAFSRDDAGEKRGSVRPYRVDQLEGAGLESADLPASLFWLAAGFSVPPGPPSGNDGCTPGYWKQEHHYGNWAEGYTPETPFDDVFEDSFPGMSLVEVLRQGGGGLNALGRHVVAGLLNAASGKVAYELTASYVIERFNEVYPASKQDYNGLKDMLEYFNERHCPLGRADQESWSVGDEDIEEGIQAARLLQNFPNPFNPETQIAFALPEPAFVTLGIYNTLGEEIRHLSEGMFGPGVHSFVWDGNDDHGNPVPSGVYIYRLSTGSQTQVRKMSLVR